MSVRKPTIPEIAKAAGVSPTTVDRVLNGRPSVHPRTVALVQDALGNLTRIYKRAESAATPVRMTFIVHSGPNPSLDSFADALVSEAKTMQENVAVTVRRIRINDPIGLARALDEAKESSDAVGAMPIGHPAVKEAAARISATKPFAALLSPLAAGSGWPFVGQDNYAAGRTAGFLMGSLLRPPSGRIAIIVGSLAFPAHEERERGFRRVLCDDFAAFELDPTVESSDDDDTTARIVEGILSEKDRVVGIYNAGGCTEVVSDVLARDPKSRGIVVIEHDLTVFTRRALLDGHLAAIVHQDMKISARTALDTLLGAIRMQDELKAPRLTKIEIITRENLP
jgi:LacI family transcriptional regulator, galactose operon repressor